MLKSQEFAAILCINKPKGTYTYLEFSILFERWEVFSLALMYRGLFLFCSASLKGNLLGFKVIQNWTIERIYNVHVGLAQINWNKRVWVETRQKFWKQKCLAIIIINIRLHIGYIFVKQSTVATTPWIFFKHLPPPPPLPNNRVING